MFLPIGFVGGLVSQLFLPFALTVTFALLASLIVALTVVPVLAYLFIDKVNVNVDATASPRIVLDPRLHAAHHVRCATAERSSPCSASRRAVLRLADARRPTADPVHQRRLGEDPAGELVPPAAPAHRRCSSEAIEAETILDAQPDVETVQTSVPGEGDAGFQTVIAPQGQPANSATMTVRLDPTVDLGETTAAFTAP